MMTSLTFFCTSAADADRAVLQRLAFEVGKPNRYKPIQSAKALPIELVVGGFVLKFLISIS